jgi:type IV pilus assembly protein PilY1
MNDVFVSVFEPSASVHWPGNLKKYRLAAGEIVGQDNQPAVDPQTGFFADTAFSFWSPAPDGEKAAEGGAASVLPTWTVRKLYTDLNGPLLTDPGNRIETGNTKITNVALGAPDPSEADEIIEWLNGRDLFDDDDDGSTDDDRNMMGDPFHVQPATVIYGGTEDSPDAVVFVNTNDGQVHAIDAKTGVELWSYIPEDMLKRAYELYRDDPIATRRYGLDGDIRVHILNDDGVPGVQAGERVILVFGMRRGGDAYYALEVTNRGKPLLLWTRDSNSAGFESLGQTWSTPVVTKVKVGADVKTVAIFGGGYDEGQDNAGYREDNVGNALYIVELLNGDLIWSAGRASGDLQLPQLTHSIPAPVGVLDVNQDGLADRMYVGDMGGRLWRFDIVNGNGANSLVEGGVLASLGAADLGAPPASEIRRFYNEPDIVPVINDDLFFYAINLGSGYRAHPLDAQIDDEFYSVRDYNVFGTILTEDYGPPLLKTDLEDITTDPNPELLPDVKGWRLSMVQSAGEKVLSKSFTFQNSVFFTSFTPSAAANACVAATGLNRLYRVDVVDGSPVTNLDDPIDDGEELTEEDRIQELQQGGIAPKPVFLFPRDRSDEPIVCIGVECLDPGMTNDLVRTFWTQDGT